MDVDLEKIREERRLLRFFGKGICERCKHEKFAKVSVVISNGNTQFRYQCVNCGKLNGQAMTRSEAVDRDGNPPPLWNAALDAVNREKMKAIYEEKNAKFLAYNGYHGYLNSDNWHAKRKMIMDRADGICEACLVSAATEVHHMTYDNVYDEFMWELRAVCRDCHERWHKRYPNMLPENQLRV